MSAAEPCRPGTEIFGCGDRAVEIAARDDVSPQRQKGAETGSANPGTNGTELDGKIPGSQGLGGRRSRMKSIGILGPKGDPQAALSWIVVDSRQEIGIKRAGWDGNNHDPGSAIDLRSTGRV